MKAAAASSSVKPLDVAASRRHVTREYVAWSDGLRVFAQFEDDQECRAQVFGAAALMLMAVSNDEIKRAVSAVNLRLPVVVAAGQPRCAGGAGGRRRVALVVDCG